jgi:hypothetical protein
MAGTRSCKSKCGPVDVPPRGATRPRRSHPPFRPRRGFAEMGEHLYARLVQAAVAALVVIGMLHAEPGASAPRSQSGAAVCEGHASGPRTRTCS